MQQNDYRFNKEKHLHEILVEDQWKALTGCTTILSVVAKPALIQWAADEAIRYLETIDWQEALKDANYLKVKFEEARTAHTKKRDKAGSWGTETHKEIETYINTGVKTDRIQPFIEWAEKNKVKFLDSEKNVYSKEMFTGGIVDILCEIDGELWIGDLKTGSGIYSEHFWQMGGYDLMLNEMGTKDIKGYIVLNLKKDGTFMEKRSISNEENRRGFLACLEIYRLLEKIKNQIL